MSLGLRLDVRQTQGLVMTPQLQQAIKLLQLSNLELQAFVESELEQNPFLERAEGTERAAAEAAPDGSGSLDGQPVLHDAEPGDGWSGDRDDGWGAEPGPLPETLGINDFAGIGRGASDSDDGRFDVEARISRPTTLRDHLLAQLSVYVDQPVDRLIGVHLIDEIDETGYFRGDTLEVAERLGIEVVQVEAMVRRLQRLDPPGVGARSLAECLALQLEDQGRL
ncbi:MAG: RNA polymerase sigma-54 factor, partial [Geminicoccaceae bacterium]|nr:RNA polymerase sigma-54 factor [Geminicoccaceae bacterium]